MVATVMGRRACDGWLGSCLEVVNLVFGMVIFFYLLAGLNFGCALKFFKPTENIISGC